MYVTASLIEGTELGHDSDSQKQNYNVRENVDGAIGRLAFETLNVPTA